ncbi:MAG: flavin reductase [Prolixibacteraceae bacterium]|nr:flavin reductase [Prolixibacteraceae bacterium]
MQYKAFHKLSYGMYLVTSAWEGARAGYVANTVFQVTSAPPQVALSCHKNNDTLQVILKSGVFSISVLKREADVSLIGEFGFMSSSWFDKFAKVNAEVKSTGAPVVSDSCVAWLDCRLVHSLDLGTHQLLIGEVLDSGLLSGEEPLTYQWYRDHLKMLAPRNAPTYIDRETLEKEENSPASEASEASATEPSGSGTDPGRAMDASPAPTQEHDPDDDEQYICVVCGYVYRPEDGDPAAGIPPGTPFSDLPEDYRCPICNAGKDYFKPLG